MASPKVARPTRTAIQGGAGYLVAEFIDEVVYDMSGKGLVLLSLILTVFFSWAQTAVEDYFGRALLRDIPEPDQPVADDARGERGEAVRTLVIVVLMLGALLLFLALINRV